MENIKIFSLGGLDENGKSLYVIDYNDSLYVFDAGVRYPEESLLGIDVILPGFQFLVDNQDRIKGIFLSHGHDENIGAVPFIVEQLDKVDIYGTDYTLIALIQTAKRFKKNISNARLHIIKKDDRFRVNNVFINSFGVTHSVPNACGFAMETGYGLVVYTGDFIVDFAQKEPYQTSFTKITELSKQPVLCLLSESYNANYSGFVSPKNKLDYKIHQILDEVKGRVFFAMYGQTIYQLQELISCAIASKRKIYLYTNHIKNLYATVNANSIQGVSIPQNIITENYNEKDCIVLVADLGNKVFQKLEKITQDAQQLENAKIYPDDCFVIAAPAHTGTERSFAQILDKLYETGASVKNISKEYVSMHAGSQDLMTMLSIFKPKYYMPVRGYYMRLVDNAKLSLDQGYNHMNILVYDNGMIANFVNGQLIRNIENIPCEEIMVDGIGIGDVGNVVINDRRKLSKDGVMIIGVSFSMSSRKIVAGPDIQMRGFVYLKDSQVLVNEVSKIFEQTVFDFVQKPGLVDFNELRNVCKEKVGIFLREKYEKDPMILPVIISV